jgi:DNA-binding NtrC family response regulator
VQNVASSCRLPLGGSPAHRQVLAMVEAAAPVGAEVLISGPSGVGKELYARLIHDRGPRRDRPFVPVNCGALPLDLFENEMFGHVGGAFTGARPRSAGLVAEAEGGTLFLDEVEALHPANQVKLLRLIQEKEYRLLGETRVRRANFRLISASNVDLVEQTRLGAFRLDLLFRLRVFPLPVPALRERAEDIPELLHHFVARYAAEEGVAQISFTNRALARLAGYAWPGNVRELENCVRFLLCTRPGQRIDAAELPLLEEAQPAAGEAPTDGQTLKAAKRRLVGDFERAYVADALARNRGNVAAAARDSGKHRRAFFELMRRYGIRTHDPG